MVNQKKKGQIIKKALAITLSVAALYIAIPQTNDIYNEVSEKLDEQPVVIPSKQSLKLISAGFEAIATDWLWIQAVQYVGAHAATEDFINLFEYIDVITDINKECEACFEFALSVLPLTNITQALELGQKGQQNIPQSQLIAYNQAFNQFYYASKPQEALETVQRIEVQAGKQKVPVRKGLQALKSSILRESGKHEVALEYWLQRAQMEQNPRQKEILLAQALREKGYLEIQEAIKKYGPPQSSLSEIIDPIPPTGADSLQFAWQDDKVILRRIKP